MSKNSNAESTTIKCLMCPFAKKCPITCQLSMFCPREEKPSDSKLKVDEQAMDDLFTMYDN